MKKDEFIRISDRVADGIANNDEYLLYNKIYNAFQQGQTPWDELPDTEKLDVKTVINARINKHLDNDQSGNARRLWYRVGIAAAVATIALNVWLFSSNSEKNLVENIAKSSVIIPGQNRATITLSSGKRFDLTSLKMGEKVSLENVSIIKKDDGTLLYSLNEQKMSGKITYNTISTPRGGQVQVNLPDGTLVFLNAATQIKVPSNLTADRNVELLEGEAYFNVAHSKDKVFRVISRKQTIEVLGTMFNVSAYLEEKTIKTTLEQGSVRVHQENGSSLIIKPGEQVINNNQELSVKSINVYDEIAWKDNMFSFERQDFKTMMRAIGRWYNVNIVFDKDVSNLHLSIQVSRSTPITRLLKTIELTGDVKFKIEGREVTVTD